MKSQQSYVCKSLIVLLSVLPLTLAYPFSQEDSAKCQPLLAEQLDPKILPKSLGDFNTFLLKDRTSNSDLSSPPEVTERARVCKGVVDKRWVGADFRVIFSVELDLKAPPSFLIAPPTYKPVSGTLLTVACEDSTQCFNITFIESSAQPQRLHRRAASHMTPEGGSHEPEKGKAYVSGLVLTVVGLIVLVVVVALCAGGSNTYDTNTTAAFKTSEDQAAVVVTTEVTVVDQQSQAEANGQKQNGSVAPEQPSTASEPTDKRHSLSPAPADQPSKPEERAERARTLSARSFDPLPEIPKLDLAEDIEKEDKDEDGEDPYSYARVLKAEDVTQSDSSDGEDVDSPNRGPSPPPTGVVPPYGKVTSSSDAVKRASLNDGEYAEVAGEGKRERSVTAPVDPAQLAGVRNNRAFTESAAHLPLPAIPKGLRPMEEEENQMYDSIPEDLNGKEAKPAKIRKDRLYESVDEMANGNEDMYESVPEELKPDSPNSPVVVSPILPEPPPLPVTAPPRPPDSPLPTHRSSVPDIKLEEPQGKGKRKQLEKTTSASAENKEKRTFSLFSRKKATSVSAGVGKTRKMKAEKEREKDTQSPQSLKPHQGEPLPDIPPLASPSQPLPSPGLPFPTTSVPAPGENEDEDMYDRPQLPEPQGKPRLPSESDALQMRMPTTEEAKARSKTLPAGMRSSGLSGFKSRQDLPLPEVPEDSGQGMVTVTHTRRLEAGSEITKPYDIIRIATPPPENQEEPNYDTVRPEVFQTDLSSEVRNDADPGYDKVGIKLEPVDDGYGDALKSDEDKHSERSTSPPGDVKVTAVAGASSPDQTLQVAAPDHDETGYARVPEMYLMRKRAMSASQGVRQKTKSPEHPKVADDSDLTQSATNPDEMYAIIDKAAKKKSRQQKQEQEVLSPLEQSSGGASPVPPPIPPFIDVGEDLSEFSEPPLPERSDDASRLVVDVENDAGYSRVLKVGEKSSDPPYAKVKSKVEHPYAELNIGGSAKPDLVSSEESPDALKPLANDMSSGYDTVRDIEPKASPTQDQADEESHTYDTLGPAEPTKDKVAHGISPEDLASDTYDSLAEEPQQNTYDSLEPEVQQNGDIEDQEGPYEEIDEYTRQNLQILHKKSLT